MKGLEIAAQGCHGSAVHEPSTQSPPGQSQGWVQSLDPRGLQEGAHACQPPPLVQYEQQTESPGQSALSSHVE